MRNERVGVEKREKEAGCRRKEWRQYEEAAECRFVGDEQETYNEPIAFSNPREMMTLSFTIQLAR